MTKRMIIKTVLLALAILSVSIGINTGDIIPSIIGGICCGVYNVLTGNEQ